jgi:hypothetical protein
MSQAVPRPAKFITDRLRGARFRVRALSLQLSGGYSHLDTFVLFVGHPRSGHTLISALLDAHPEVVIGNEVHVLKHIAQGMSRPALFHQIIDSAEQFAQQGATWQGYSYAVPDQWQGRVATLRVLGDKHAPATIRYYGAQPEILVRLRQVIGPRLKLRFVHTIRNPFDNIATIWRRQSVYSLTQCADEYFGRCASTVWLNNNIKPEERLDMRLESFIVTPQDCITVMCRFVGVEPSEQYLRDCARIVFDSPNRSRHDAPWTPDLIASVQQRINGYDFLSGYTFEA